MTNTDNECKDIAKGVAERWEKALEYSNKNHREPPCEDWDCYEDEDAIEYMLENDVLDIRVNCFLGSGKETFRYAELCVGWGGPNVYINCGEYCVEVYWGASEEKYPISSDLCERINEWVQEYWFCCEKERD